MQKTEKIINLPFSIDIKVHDRNIKFFNFLKEKKVHRFDEEFINSADFLEIIKEYIRLKLSQENLQFSTKSYYMYDMIKLLKELKKNMNAKSIVDSLTFVEEEFQKLKNPHVQHNSEETSEEIGTNSEEMQPNRKSLTKNSKSSRKSVYSDFFRFSFGFKILGLGDNYLSRYKTFLNGIFFSFFPFL